MKRHIKTKFLVPILLLQFIALGTLGFIGYRFSSDMLRNAAEQSFSKRINTAYEVIEQVQNDRIAKIKNLLGNPIFIKYSAAPYYKSDVDVEIFNFQKGNGLVLGEPEVGGLVNYPIGLLANEGGRKILDAGIFPSEEYVGPDGIVKQHVYLGGSNDVDFETSNNGKLSRSDTEWFKTAIAGRVYIGRPQKMPLFLRGYDPVSISASETRTEKELIPIALPHRIGDRIVGVMMMTTTPDFIYNVLPEGKFKSLLLIVDKDGNAIAEAGDTSIGREMPKTADKSLRLEPQDKIMDEGKLLTMHRTLPISDWSIAMFGRKADIYGGVYKLRNNILLVMAISLVVMGIIVFAIIQRLLHPILRLTKASDKIADGELGVVIEKSDDDEIGRLTDSFNKMSTSTRDMHDRLSRINFVRKQLLQIISHELRTPLNGIMGFYELLKEEIQSGGAPAENKDEFNECFEGLGNCVDKYRRLVERLTKTTSVMSGEMRAGEEVDKEPCNLVEAAGMAIEETKKYTKNLESNIDSPKLQNAMVACPKDAVRLILDEALSNAIKYSPEGSPIKVRLTVDDKAATIEVRDSGNGIPKDYISEIIEPFFEVKDSKLHFTDRYKKGGGGLGLGLTIIGSILRRYRGTFKIESEEGKGTTLTMSLPILSSVSA